MHVQPKLLAFVCVCDCRARRYTRCAVNSTTVIACLFAIWNVIMRSTFTHTQFKRCRNDTRQHTCT